MGTEQRSMTLSEFIENDGAIYNDRGNGSGGPQYIMPLNQLPEDDPECEVWEREVVEVTEKEDPEAWALAREAAEAIGAAAPYHVAIDAGVFQPSEYCGIYAE